MDGARKLPDLSGAQAGRGASHGRGERRDEFGERFKSGGVPDDVIALNPAICNQDVCQAIEKCKVALWFEGNMLCRRHGGFRLARVHHDDFRPVLVPHDALPHDRVRDARVCADEHQHVALLKIRVGERRRVKPERFLVGDVRRGHALARVAVAMQPAYAEFPGPLHQVRGERPVPLPEEGILPGSIHAAALPGILAGATAAKNKYRSSSSPATHRTIPAGASHRAGASPPARLIMSNTGKMSPPSTPQPTRTRAAKPSSPASSRALLFRGVGAGVSSSTRLRKMRCSKPSFAAMATN